MTCNPNWPEIHGRAGARPDVERSAWWDEDSGLKKDDLIAELRAGRVFRMQRRCHRARPASSGSLSNRSAIAPRSRRKSCSGPQLTTAVRGHRDAHVSACQRAIRLTRWCSRPWCTSALLRARAQRAAPAQPPSCSKQFPGAEPDVTSPSTTAGIVQYKRDARSQPSSLT
jgi:hypothetical protein